MADGENIERFWSTLGQLSYITREMSATPRQDLVVDELLHMSRKSITKAPATMVSRLSAAHKLAAKAQCEIDRLCNTVEGKY